MIIAPMAATRGPESKGENWQGLAGVEKVLPMKYWEIIADRLSAAGWSWGMTSATDAQTRTLFVVDAHRDDGRRFVVRSDELLTAFLELERNVWEGESWTRRMRPTGIC